MKSMKWMGVSLLSFAIAGCGSPSRAPTTESEITRVEPPVRGAMQLEVKVVTARGRVDVRTSEAGPWQPLAEGASLAGVYEVRAVRRGAIIALGHGDAAGRLWMRGGSTVRLGQDARGVHVAVREGRARLRRTGANLPVFVDVATGSQSIDGDYVLLARDGSTDSIPTGVRPELVGFSLLLEEADEARGVGRLEARVANGNEALALRAMNVTVKTAGDLAITEVEHVFHNSADENREGTFRFPVPDGALLTGMAMEIKGEMIEGEIVEREKAREIYEKIVDEMQDPALLEWEEGNWFKLRVFPIEAKSNKRVVIRYASPLVHGASGWEYVYTLGDPRIAIDELSITVDGKLASRETKVTQGIDLVVPVGDDQVPRVMREERPDGIYTAVRVPMPANLAAPVASDPRASSRNLAIIVDTSRSALEGKPLELELVKTALRELGPNDRFAVLAADIAVTHHDATGFVLATPDAIAAAIKFLDGIEPDGASDLGGALAAVAKLSPTDVIYVGDGIPTWGDRDAVALGKIATMIGAPIQAGLVGKGASTELWNELTGRNGGRAQVVRRSVDAKQFALAAIHARNVVRLDGARVEVANATVFPAQARTMFAGDELVTLIRTPADQPAPTALVLSGFAGGKPVVQTISIDKPIKVAHVMQRWAAFQLVALDSAGAPREDIVKLSRDAGLISRYTSLLVLENDEAFKQHQIERKQQQLADAQKRGPQITGGDLDSLGATRPSLAPDEIQPGDPEIKIPAPRDAQSVVVNFPFGETKRAVWDSEVNAWMVRFLIDKETADGDYMVRVTITHADGRIELVQLPYTVDTQPPNVELSVTRVVDGYRIRAKQIASADGSRRKDADRIEVMLPDGTILVLAQTAWGRFEGVWQTASVAAPVTLRVITSDRALNQSTSELTVR